jgi:hypothetical protein
LRTDKPGHSMFTANIGQTIIANKIVSGKSHKKHVGMIGKIIINNVRFWNIFN